MIKDHFQEEIQVPATLLKRGSQGIEVKRAQEWINLWKFYNASWSQQLVIDGDFGSVTEVVVKQFQVFGGLGDDGIIGPVTWAELVKPMSPGLFFNRFLRGHTFRRQGGFSGETA